MSEPTPTPDLKPGDVVTLKTWREEFVVAGPVWSVPALYLVRRIDPATGTATELAVRRCEIATAYRPPTLVVADGPPAGSAPAGADWRDVEYDFGLSPINWGPTDARGTFVSLDGRFRIQQRNGNWVATDWDGIDTSPEYALPADAVEWCERQLTPAAAPEAEPAALAWRDVGGLAQKSVCGRFRVDAVRDARWQVVPGTFRASDERMADHGSPLRWSGPDSLAGVRAWCEQRAKFNVVLGEAGPELVPADNLPF